MHVPQEWYDRYAMRMEEFRLPKEARKRQALREHIGQDGWELLGWRREAGTPTWLRAIPAGEIRRQVWRHQWWIEEGQVRWRSPDTIPPSARLISSPSALQAHLSIKRETVWTG